DVQVSAINYQSALKKIFTWIDAKQKNYVCVAAVHLVMECQKSAQLRAGVNRAGLVTPDGMPLAWLLKINGKKQTERVYGPDLMLKVCQQASQTGKTIFLLGGAKGQSRQLKTVLEKKFPKIKIVGHADTPIRPIPKQKNQQIIKQLNASRAQIVFVGLGCPLQEEWMITNLPHLKTGVAIGVGAAFDFITGKTKQAPRWLMSAGLEWLFRLLQEPQRLAYRYLVLNSLFIFLIGKQFLISLTKKLKRILNAD
ncbi:MAG: WecB/TagA/CpsF family glycosyltransferase, partial [Candidatus Paceibacterota bacterium]